MINNLWIFVLVHPLGDFIFQPEKWAINKREKKKYLFYHSLQYTILFLIAFYFLNISFYWGIWIFLTHLIIDDYRLLRWWNTKVKREKKTPEWLTIVQDQILHILALIPIVI